MPRVVPYLQQCETKASLSGQGRDVIHGRQWQQQIDTRLAKDSRWVQTETSKRIYRSTQRRQQGQGFLTRAQMYRLFGENSAPATQYQVIRKTDVLDGDYLMGKLGRKLTLEGVWLLMTNRAILKSCFMIISRPTRMTVTSPINTFSKVIIERSC
jgi:hypothetical protein